MLILLGLNRIKKKMKYPNYYVQHYQKEDDKVKWCYIGSNNKLPDEYKIKINYYEDQTLHNYTQQYNDFTQHQKRHNSTFFFEKDWCGGRDSNPRSPKARDLESCASSLPQGFDLALPPPPRPYHPLIRY